MTKTIENLFILLGTVSDLIPILFLLPYYSLIWKEIPLRILVVGCTILFLLNAASYLGPSYVKNIIYPIFTVIEFTLFATFLWYNIRKNNIKRAIIIATLLFYGFMLFEFFVAAIDGLDSVPIGVESIMMLIISFYYLYEQMNDVSAQFIYNKYHFWIVAGLMIYLAGSFFIYVFANQVDKTILQQWWVITVILYIVKNIFFLIGISLFIRQKKQPPRMDHSYYPYLN